MTFKVGGKARLIQSVGHLPAGAVVTITSVVTPSPAGPQFGSNVALAEVVGTWYTAGYIVPIEWTFTTRCKEYGKCVLNFIKKHRWIIYGTLMVGGCVILLDELVFKGKGRKFIGDKCKALLARGK